MIKKSVWVTMESKLENTSGQKNKNDLLKGLFRDYWVTPGGFRALSKKRWRICRVLYKRAQITVTEISRKKK